MNPNAGFHSGCCGIPGEVVSQLKQVHARTEQARTNVCAAGPAAAGPALPSLSEALGTTRLPVETKKTGANYLDTLTGNVIQSKTGKAEEDGRAPSFWLPCLTLDASRGWQVEPRNQVPPQG
jgi:hypothetical protein